MEAGTPPRGGSSSSRNGYLTLVTNGNGDSVPATTNGIVDSAAVTDGIGHLRLATNGNSDSARPAINGTVRSLKANRISNVAVVSVVCEGITNSAPLTSASRQAQQQSVPSEPTSQWIPKALVFYPYVRPSPCVQLKQNGRVPNGFHMEEQAKQKNVKRCPLVVTKMTKDIRDTYEICCRTKRILTVPSKGVSNNGRDNFESDLILHAEDFLENSESNVTYVVKEMLGKGSYGQVCQCWTSNPIYQKRHVAVKVMKREFGSSSTERELNIFKVLNDRGACENANIVRFLEDFTFAGHSCLVFELLSVDLRVLLNFSRNAGLSIKVVRRFTVQIVEALTALEGAGVVHCDIKPENIALHSPLNESPSVKTVTETILKHYEALRNAGVTHPRFSRMELKVLQWFLENKARVKVIDFGIAGRSETTFLPGGRNTYIQSRHYRAPEIVLKLPFYTPAIDMWSVGCVAAELFLGVPLFMGANEYDLLRFMIDILGSQPPDDIISVSEAEVGAIFFKQASSAQRSGERVSSEAPHQRYEFLSEDDIETRVRAYGLGKPKAGKRNFGSKGLGEIIMETKSIDKQMSAEEMSEEIDSRKAFFHFLLGVLQFDYRKRWTPSQALQHPFLSGKQPSSLSSPR